MRKVLARILAAGILGLIVFLGYSPSPAHAVESFCPGGSNPDSHVIVCDDFESGAWIGRWADATGGEAVNCNLGYNSRCTWDSGPLYFDGSWGFSGRYGWLNFPDGVERTELYVRYYQRASHGYQFGYPDDPQGDKGVYLRNQSGDDAVPNVKSQFCRFADGPAYTTCRPAMSTYGDAREDLAQNQGADLHVDSNSDAWYFVKYYIKLNTPGVANGVFKMWAERAPFTGNPTLRLSYTDVMIRPSGVSRGYNALWVSLYNQRCNGGCPSVRSQYMYMDQLVVSTADIPPMGGTTSSNPPPNPPMNLIAR